MGINVLFTLLLSLSLNRSLLWKIKYNILFLQLCTLLSNQISLLIFISFHCCIIINLSLILSLVALLDFAARVAMRPVGRPSRNPRRARAYYSAPDIHSALIYIRPNIYTNYTIQIWTEFIFGPIDARAMVWLLISGVL